MVKCKSDFIIMNRRSEMVDKLQDLCLWEFRYFIFLVVEGHFIASFLMIAE